MKDLIDEKDNNIILKKSFAFPVRITMLCQFLQEKNCEYIFSKQVLKIRTFIGENREGAIDGQLKKYFIAKFSLSGKEFRAKDCWFQFLKARYYMANKMFDSLCKDLIELTKILASIIMVSQRNF